MAEKMTAESKVWKLPIDVDASGIVTKTLQTADTYVDKNIQVTVTTPDAEFELKDTGAITATVSTSDTTYTSDTETPYAITIEADATVAKTVVGVKTAGFAADTDTIEVAKADAETNTKTIYVKEGHLQGSGEASADGSIKMTQVTEAPTTGFYVHANASGGTEVDVAGWLPKGAKATSNGDAYYTIDNVAFNNAGTAGKEYTDISETAPALISGDYLYINEGYTGDVKISLAKLVPDGTDIKGGEQWLYKGHTAYDDDGNKVTGTMGDAKLSAITASDAAANIGTVTVAWSDDDSTFKVAGSGDISGTASVSIEERGLATTDMKKEGVISGSAAVDASLAQIALGVDANETDLTVTPTLKQGASSAKSGEITTTQPTGRYIAVSADAVEKSVTVNPKVNTAGYGDADHASKTGVEITAGSDATETYYIPVTAGSHSAEAGTPAIQNATATVRTDAEATAGFDGDLVAGIKTTAPEGVYITISGDATAVKGSVSGTVTCTSTEGYIEGGSETASIAGDVEVTVTAAADKYIRVYDGTIL